MVERQLPKLHTGVRFPSPAHSFETTHVPAVLEKVTDTSAVATLGPDLIAFSTVPPAHQATPKGATKMVDVKLRTNGRDCSLTLDQHVRSVRYPAAVECAIL